MTRHAPTLDLLLKPQPKKAAAGRLKQEVGRKTTRRLQAAVSEGIASAMILIPRDATSEQVLEIVRGWIDLLAAEDYQAAFDAIGAWGIHGDWTPEFIRDDIKNYRSPEFYPGMEDFRVTDWRTAQGGNPEAEQTVLWYADSDNFPLAGAVAFDLPLNGRWSTLTADFVLWKNGDAEDCSTLGLEEITSWQQRAAEDGSADVGPTAA